MAQRVFVDQGVRVVFSSISFREEIRKYQASERAKGNKVTMDRIYNDLADALHKSPDAVKNWYKGVNGTDDIQTIKEIAMFLKIDYTDL